MYQRILIPLDGSELAECVLPHLETLLKDCPPPEVIVARSVEPIIPYVISGESTVMIPVKQTQAVEAQEKQAAEEYLTRIIARLQLSGIKATAHVLSGRAQESLIAFATEKKVDMVIISTHGRSGLGKLIWGSVADHLLRSLNVPVMMVRPCVNKEAN